MPKVYCKYCYQHVSLVVGDDIYECSNCGSGLAPLDLCGHTSYTKFKECAELRFAVMNEAIKHFKMRGTSEDMDQCHPTCPHTERRNTKLYDLPLIIELRRKVGLPDDPSLIAA
ncbi:MAG: hypothetical protein HMLIMOIP_002620 [Candidatus Nitrosomirales archaeon]|jgi:hypothetical protein